MKKYIILVLIALLIGALFVGVLAAPQGQAGKSNVAHLYFYEKDAGWVIVDGGAWGKMKHNLSGADFEFVFNGHGLVADTNYTLMIYHPDSWPGTGICLGTGIANDGGELSIAGSYDIGEDLADFKVWLVLTDDVTCGTGMIYWNPGDYLFENNLISFDDTDA